MNNMDEFVKEYLKNGTWYDFMGQSIFTKSEEVGDQIVCDVRGWGTLQYKDNGSGL